MAIMVVMVMFAPKRVLTTYTIVEVGGCLHLAVLFAPEHQLHQLLFWSFQFQFRGSGSHFFWDILYNVRMIF